MLWPWRRLVAVALIRALAWEPPYAAGTALKKKKKKKILGLKKKHSQYALTNIDKLLSISLCQVTLLLVLRE